MSVTLIAPAGVGSVLFGGSMVAVGADGTAAFDPGADKLSFLLNAGWKYFRTAVGWNRFAAPIAAELISIVAATIPVSGTPYTIAAQPDYPRKLQVRCVQSGAVASLVLNLVGTDVRGNALAETVNVAGASTATFTTKNAFAHVTSSTPVGTVTNVTTLGVGVAPDLAMTLPAGFVDFAIVKANLDAADVATANGGTIDLVAGTVSPATAPNATHNYDFWWSAGLAD